MALQLQSAHGMGMLHCYPNSDVADNQMQSSMINGSDLLQIATNPGL